uniref:Variant surface glycoprotein 1125.5030 n=1 Tax=Trypanosoma brucei TaxID=5691 RepID=A0A1J0RBP1_9TRYP|nr:variant surface glycoprotein 1125.5030 [Trypanosoma brucei]
MKGRIHEFVTLLQKAQTSSATSGYFLATTGPAHAAGAVAAYGCGAEHIPTDAIENPISPDELTDEGINHGASSTIEGKTNGGTACLLTVDANNANTAFFQNNAQVELLGGLLAITPNSGGKSNAVADTKKLRNNGNLAGTKPLHKSYDALRKINSEDTSLCPTTVETVIKTAATPDKLKEALKTLHKNTKRDETAQLPESKQEALVATLLGTDGKQLQALIDNIQATAVINKANPKNEDKTLKTIQDTEELAEILEYYREKAAITAAAEITRLQAVATKSNQGAGTDICSKIADKNECNSKHFCSYNESAEEAEKKCKFNLTKAEKKGFPVTQTKTGETETTTEKCTGKLEDACKKVTGCNWDGKECKDSSILVNKQFALSVVSAAFVALLFKNFSPSIF